MSVTSVDKDFENLTLTLTADFDAPATRVWQLWSDPRQLERWWGPPTYPATFDKHDFTPGGEIGYYMTGPDGGTHRGWWRIVSIDAPKALEFTDGFADDDGNPLADMPVTTVHMQLTETDAGTRMVMRSTFPSREQMDQLVTMGMAEGLQEAVGQMDALLTD